MGTVFAYSGLGPRHWGMGRELLAVEPVFRAVLEECDRVAARHAEGLSLLAALDDERYRTRLDECQLCYPATVGLQIALTALWRSWGVVPDVLFGVSGGEAAAAWAAGALGIEDALRVAIHTGRLVQVCSSSARMMMVMMAPDELAPLVDAHRRRISLAARMSPGFSVVSGDVGALAALGAELQRRGVAARPVPLSWAAHAAHVTAVRDQLLALLAPVHPRATTTRLFSTVTGREQPGEGCDADYWWRNLRGPVLFMEAVAGVVDEGHTTFVEIGPDPTLSLSIEQALARARRRGLVVPSLRRAGAEPATMRASLAALRGL